MAGDSGRWRGCVFAWGFTESNHWFVKRKTFISLHDLSQRSGLPSSWLRSEAEAGRLPSLRAGRRLMFHAETVERVLLERAARQVQAAEGEASNG